MGRHVDTLYGPVPGCPDCGVIVLFGEPHICEHGVTPALNLGFEITMTYEDQLAHDRMLYGFSVIDEHGRRVDPRDIRPAP